MNKANAIPFHILSSGQQMPVIGMGTYSSGNVSAEDVAIAVEEALKQGYRLFDCASYYHNEAEIGEVFQKVLNNGALQREELFVVSKVWNHMHGQGEVLASCQQSLKDLQLDFVDAFLLHWPFSEIRHEDGSVEYLPFELERYMATWRQLEDLVDKGLAVSIGMSNMTVKKLKAVLPLCSIRPTVLEVEMHPSFQQPDLFNYCARENIRILTYAPLGAPRRSARNVMAGDTVDMAMPEILAIAKAHEITPEQVALKWAVQRGQVPIPFSSNAKHLYSNLISVLGAPLSEEEMASIAKDDKNNRFVRGIGFMSKEVKSWQELWDEA